MSLIRVVRMTFRPEAAAAFLENFEIHKSAIRNFPGCRYLELWQDQNQKNIFDKLNKLALKFEGINFPP